MKLKNLLIALEDANIRVFSPDFQYMEMGARTLLKVCGTHILRRGVEKVITVSFEGNTTYLIYLEGE